jgi:hypothetical protein
VTKIYRIIILPVVLYGCETSSLTLREEYCLMVFEKDAEENMKVYQKVSGLAAFSENCKWYSSLPLGAVLSIFYESV